MTTCHFSRRTKIEILKEIGNKEKILDIVFPPRCALCDTVLPPGGGYICDECTDKLSFVKEPRCFKCGKTIAAFEEEYCMDCSRRKRSYIKGYPVFNYVPPISESIMALKYGRRQEYSKFFGRIIADKYGEEFIRIGIDALVSVPVFKKKYATRGYNQAELIALEIERRTGIMNMHDFLVRVEETPPQKELTDEEREKNMIRAFSIGKGFASGKSENVPSRILLVDDIYTSGATIEACTRVLLAAGVKEVYYTSVAIGVSS